MSMLGKYGRAGTPLPAAARTECAPYHTRRKHYECLAKSILPVQDAVLGRV
jgi:hypothetical protein